jgi:hypothetical protein
MTEIRHGMQPHGTYSRYNVDECRCDDCRAANTAQSRDLRSRLRQVPADQIPHGTTNGYNNYGCRCDDCRAEQAKCKRDARARRARRR